MAEARLFTNKEQRLARKAEKRSRAQPDEGEEGLQTAQGKISTARGSGNGRDGIEDAAPLEAVEGEEAEEEIEAVSHKEMRKRRKLDKQAARRGAQNASVVEKGAEGKQDGPPQYKESQSAQEKVKAVRSPYSLWIGNLSFFTHPDRVQQWLEDGGVQGITRMHMPKGARRMEHNRGFCYVDVPSADMVKAGISMSEGHLDGRKLLIKAGSDFTGRPALDPTVQALASRQSPQSKTSGEDGSADAVVKGKTGLTKTAQKILRAQRHPPGPTLFFGNLGFSATEEGVREMIERSASVRNELEQEKSIKTAKNTNRKEGGGSSASNSDSDSSSESESSSGSESESEVSNDNDEASSAKEEDSNTAETKKELQSKDQRDGRPRSIHLRGAGIRKVRMGQFEDTGKCKGFAFVDFHSPSYATAALIDPHNGFLDGRQLIVQYAGPEAVRRGAPKNKGLQTSEQQRQGPRRYTGLRHHVADGQDDNASDSATLQASAPLPGSFDPDAPLPKKHKETKEERIRRREEAKTGSNGPYNPSRSTSIRRAKPGAALANAQRGKTSIDFTAPKGVKKTFD